MSRVTTTHTGLLAFLGEIPIADLPPPEGSGISFWYLVSRTGHRLLTPPPATTTLTNLARAQFGGPAGFGGGYGGGKASPYSAAADADADADGADEWGLSFGHGTAARARTAHGILACLAFVVLFPLGAILVRVVPGRWSFHAHWVVQMLAWMLYVAAFALGVELVKGIRWAGGDGDFVSVSSSLSPMLLILSPAVNDSAGGGERKGTDELRRLMKGVRYQTRLQTTTPSSASWYLYSSSSSPYWVSYTIETSKPSSGAPCPHTCTSGTAGSLSS